MNSKYFVSKNKFGELAPQPLFGREVVFFKVINPPSNGREGEEWECEVLSTIRSGKKDKHGKDILIRTVKFLNKIEHKKVEFNQKNKKWEIKTFCGNVLTKKENYSSDSVEFVFRAPCIIQIAKFKEHSREISSTWIRTSKDIPTEIPEEVKAYITDWLNKINRIDQEEKEKLETIKSEMASVINEGTKTFPNDVLRALITKGGEITFKSKNPRIPTESLYVFDVAGFRFDKDGEQSSCGKITNPTLKNTLQKISNFITHPTPKTLFEALELKPVPEQTTLLSEKVSVESHGQNSRGSRYTKYCEKSEAMTQVKKKIDDTKNALTVEVVETSFQDLVRITYTYELVEKISTMCDASEYDFSLGSHYHTYVQGTLVKTWKVKDYYISPDVCEQVRELILKTLVC